MFLFNSPRQPIIPGTYWVMMKGFSVFSIYFSSQFQDINSIDLPPCIMSLAKNIMRKQPPPLRLIQIVPARQQSYHHSLHTCLDPQPQTAWP